MAEFHAWNHRGNVERSLGTPPTPLLMRRADPIPTVRLRKEIAMPRTALSSGRASVLWPSLLPSVVVVMARAGRTFSRALSPATDHSSMLLHLVLSPRSYRRGCLL